MRVRLRLIVAVQVLDRLLAQVDDVHCLLLRDGARVPRLRGLFAIDKDLQVRGRVVVRCVVVLSLLLERGLLLERPGAREAHVRPVVLAPAELPLLLGLPVLLALASADLQEGTLIVVVVLGVALSLPRISERILLLNEPSDSLLLDDRVMVPLTASNERRDVSLRLIGLDASLSCDLISRLDLERMLEAVLLAHKVGLVVGVVEVLVIVGRVLPLLDNSHRLLFLACEPQEGVPMGLVGPAASHRGPHLLPRRLVLLEVRHCKDWAEGVPVEPHCLRPRGVEAVAV